MSDARKPSEKPMQWHVEQYADRFPDYWKAEHPCGSEIHVWRGYKREPAWGFEPSPEEPVGWYFEIKGGPEHCQTPYEYVGGKTADEAKAAALAWLEEVIADHRQTFRHSSDCALHNAPAAMPRWCSCDGPKSLTEFLGFWWLWFTRRA